METSHFRIYYDPTAHSQEAIQLLAEDAEFRYFQLQGLFQRGLPRPVGLYLYSSAEQKRRWIGAEWVQLADPIHLELHLNPDEFPHGVLKHELAHLFAGQLHRWMRLSRSPGLLEGVAVAADWEEGELTPHEWAAALAQTSRLPSLKELMSLRRFWGISSSRAYLASGSFVRWLWESYGLDAVRIAYPFGDFRRATGRSLDQLEAEWRRYLGTVPVPKWALRRAERRLVQPAIVEQTCPHRVAALETEAWALYRRGAFEAARQRFQEAARLEPNRPLWRWRVLQTEMAAGRWEQVASAARQLIAELPEGSGGLRADLLEALGDALWWQGQEASSRAAYQQALEAASSSAQARGLELKLQAFEGSPALQRAVRNYFFPRTTAAQRLYWASRCVTEEPEWAGGHYLLGVQLYNAGLWTEAEAAFSKALARGLPPLLRAEALRRQGIARYRIGAYQQAQESFALAEEALSQTAWRFLMRSWQQRARWRYQVGGRARFPETDPYELGGFGLSDQFPEILRHLVRVPGGAGERPIQRSVRIEDDGPHVVVVDVSLLFGPDAVGLDELLGLLDGGGLPELPKRKIGAVGLAVLPEDRRRVVLRIKSNGH